MQFSIDIHAGGELDGYDEADDYLHEARDLAAEVEQMTLVRDAAVSEIDRLISERDEALAELAQVRDQLRNEQGAAANAWQATCDELAVELAKFRKASAEVVWACPASWKTGWLAAVRNSEVSVQVWKFNRLSLRELFGVAFPPQDGAYEIVASGRAVLVKGGAS